jgi:hypothetical protein
MTKLISPEGGKCDVADGRWLSDDGRQPRAGHFAGGPLAALGKGGFKLCRGHLQEGGERAWIFFCRRPPCRPLGGQFCTVEGPTAKKIIVL